MRNRNGKLFGKASVVFLSLFIILNSLSFGTLAFAEDSVSEAAQEDLINETSEETAEVTEAVVSDALDETLDAAEQDGEAVEDADQTEAEQEVIGEATDATETEEVTPDVIDDANEDAVDPSTDQEESVAVEPSKTEAPAATTEVSDDEGDDNEESQEATSEDILDEELNEDEESEDAEADEEAEEDVMWIQGETVSSWAELQAAVNAAAEGEETEILVSGDFTADSKITIPANKNILLKSDGSAKITSGGTEIFEVARNGKLTMDGDITLDGANKSSLIIVRGDFTLNKGKIVNGYSDNALDGKGGGVSVYLYGKMTMNGGEIANCTGVRGGGIFLKGSTSRDDRKATLIINGGEIHHNVVHMDGKQLSSGGGVYAENAAVVTVNGGSIHHNKANGGLGGGIACTNGDYYYDESQEINIYRNLGVNAELTLNAGDVSYNEVTMPAGMVLNTKGTTAGSGGGIYIAANKCAINGGEIHDNKAENQGGGVYVASVPYVLDIYNMVVTNNHAKETGGGVWFCPTGTTTVGTNSGSAIYGNKADGAGDDFTNDFGGHKGNYVSQLHEKFLGGGDAEWVQDGKVETVGDNELGTGSRDGSNTGIPASEAVPGWNENITTSIALKSNADEATIKAANAMRSVYIYNNEATWGGGIGSNGGIKINYDDNKYKDIEVTKVWDTKKEEDKEKIPESLQIKLINVTLGEIVEIIELNAGNNWHYVFKNLLDKFEFAVEEGTVEGWEQSSYTTETSEENGRTIVKITIVNALPPEPKEVLISKVDLSGEELPGAEIEIKDADGNVVDSWTSTTEPHKVELLPGTYVFHEVAAPNGYIAVTDITFEVDDEGSVTITNINGNTAVAEDGKLTVTDQDAPEEVLISKVDLSGEELPGAQIEIKDNDGNVVASWTSTTESHKLVLEPGTYVFHEVAAPDGYVAVTDITFEVDEDGNVTITEIDGNTAVAEDGKLTVTDQDAPPPIPPTPGIEVSKVDLSGTELPGAQIEIKDNDGNVVASWTSTTESHKLVLEPGTYVFHEVAAPNGYVAVTDITFEVDEKGNVTITDINGNTAVAEGGKLTVTDQEVPPPIPPTPGIEISKVDLSGTELPGAQIEIRDTDGNVVASWTSTTEPHALVLEPGTYVFHEVAAPNGYVAVTDITFEVDEKGNVTITDINGNTAVAEGGKLTVTDQEVPPPIPPTPGVEISKVDLSGKELPGAQIEIRDADGNVVASWTSTTEPHALVLKAGRYVFHEVAAPNGYVAVTDITFEVDEKGNITIIDLNGNTAVAEGGKLTVTDQEEPPKVPPTAPPTKTPPKQNPPAKTGDETNIMSWIALAGLSAALAMVIGARKRIADKL